MITRYPLSSHILTDLNQLVSGSWNGDVANGSGIESIKSDEYGWEARVALPGFKKEEIKIHAGGNCLNITAETDDKDRDFLATQKRRVKVSDDADFENVKAKLEDGILYLHIPIKEKDEPKLISIQ